VITTAVCLIAAGSIAGIVLRPRGLPEWLSACSGAALVVVFGLLPGREALRAVAGGWDVYLFLFGMLALAEILRAYGVFDVLAARLASFSLSPLALFSCVYAIGVAVTAVLSNDGTIVLLTPAAIAVAARARLPVLPIAFAVAMVSNAASFVLPISNPANLVLFANLPRAGEWIDAFGLASLAAILVTWASLAIVFRRDLHAAAARGPNRAGMLPRASIIAAVAVGTAAATIVASAAMGWNVGITAGAAGALLLLGAALHEGARFRSIVAQGPWSIIPLVAGLFVIVHALDRTRVLSAAGGFLQRASLLTPWEGKLATGFAVTAAANVLNNLPAGVLARYALHSSALAPHIAHAALVGIDLGPNLSLSGSLATLLWLMILRRADVTVRPLYFLRAGLYTCVPSLLLSLLATR
jgi:arsenical pump membrane protein